MRNFDYCRGIVHVIKKGDSLYAISKKHNVPLALIMRANPYADVYNLQVGDEICIPVTNMGGIGNICTGNNCMPGMSEPSMPGMPGMSEPSMPGMPGMSEPSMPGRPGMSQPPMPGMPGMPQPPMPGRPGMSEPSMPGRPGMSQPSMPGRPGMPEPSMPGRPGMSQPSMPPGVNLITYIVKDAESLKDILEKFDIDLEDFIENNNMSTILLKPGMTINIPDKRLREEDEE